MNLFIHSAPANSTTDSPRRNIPKLNDKLKKLRHHPLEIIQDCLNIELNGQNPFVSISVEKGIRAKTYKSKSPNKIHTQSERVIDQNVMFFQVITALQSSTKLISLSDLQAKAPQIISASSSADSLERLKTDKKDSAQDIFDTYLLTIKTKTPRDKKVKTKSNVFLSIAYDAISPSCSKDPSLERHYRNLLASSLEWHLNKHIKPLILVAISNTFTKSLHKSSHPCSDFKFEQREALLDLQKESLDQLLSYHYNIAQNPAIKKKEVEILKKFAKKEIAKTKDNQIDFKSHFENDLKSINEYHLFDQDLIAHTLEACVIKYFNIVDLRVLGTDICRQINYIKVKKDQEDDQILPLKETPAKIKIIPSEAETFNNNVDSLKTLISTFLSQLSNNLKTPSAKKISQEIENLRLNPQIHKNEDGFLEICVTLVKDLQNCKDGSQDHQLSLTKQKLHFLLLTLTQNTYQIPGVALNRILTNYPLKFGGADSRLLQYNFFENSDNITEIELNVITKAYPLKNNNFEMIFMNKMHSSVPHISCWSSELQITVIMNKTSDSEVRDVINDVVIPLKNSGFSVQFHGVT